jgi:uncharacterized protein (TIGR01777 family)
MKTVVISGASGFIGQALASRLAAQGLRVRPLVRPGRNAPDGIRWDPQAGTLDEDALAGADALVHLAGENIGERRWNDAEKARLLQSRVQSTELIARALSSVKDGPRTWISASAVGYYGDRGDMPLDESEGAGSDFLARLCVAWEAPTARVPETVRVVRTRFGVVLDPAGGALARMLTPFKLGVGGRIGSGRQWVSWVALHDVTRALAFLLERSDLSGPFNITAPTPVTNAELTDALGAALHRPTVLPLPGFAARLALGEFAQAALLSSARVMPKRLTESGFRFDHPLLAPYLVQVLRG